MQKKHVLLIFFALLLSCGSLLAQTKRTITGVVTDSEGKPVPGATVAVKGTTNGTSTDTEGKYSIEVSTSNPVLQVSSIGFANQEVKVTREGAVDISLASAGEKAEEEVVVTALGIKRDKKSVGYAITSLKGDDLMKAGNTVNPLTALYGQAAGVGISVGSAGPTGSVNIKIRGAAGLQTDTKTRPLIVVDGVPIYDENSNMESRGYDPLNSFDYGSGINDINGEDIESIEILKGAKASVLYGSRAGNGVIMITTKKGAKTRGFGVNLSFQSMMETPVSFINWQNEYGSGTTVFDTVYGKDRSGNAVRIMNNARQQFGPRFDGSSIMFYDSTMRTYQAYPNNWNDLFKNTFTNIYNAAISGANDKGSMRLSYTRKDYKGQMNNFFQKDNTISFHGQMNVSEFANFEVNTNLYNISTQNRYPNIARLVSYGFNRDIDYQSLANNYKDRLGQQYQYSMNPLGVPASVGGDNTGYFGMLWDQNENKNIDNKTHLVSSFKFTLKFTPWLSLTSSAGIDYTDWDFITKDAVSKTVPTVSGGKYAFQRKNYNVLNYNSFLNFNKTFSNGLDLFAFAGPEYSKTTYNDVSQQTVGGLLYPNWYDITAGISKSGDFGQTGGTKRTSQVLYSVLGSASLGYKSTYYLELSARNDWSSLLPPKYNSYFYPGASATWNFSNNLKLPDLNYGKFRFSWANVGRGAPYPYFAYQSYGLGVAGTSQVPTVYGPTSLFAGDIKPERNNEYEVGFNTRWFKKKPLEVDFSFYTGNVYDQIMALNLTNSTAFSNIKLNAGNVKKWGYELFVKYSPISNEKLRWDVTFNAANQRSKVVKLYPGMTQYAITGSGAYSIMAIEGKPIGDVQAFDYLRDPSGNKIVGSTGLYSPDKTKLITVANVNPDFIGGFGTDFYYKSFNLHLGFDYKFGGTYLSYSNYYLLGNGSVEESLKFRDEANGGRAYYIDASGKKIPWQHNQPAPAGAVKGRVYHDGVIQPGVKEVTDGSGNTSYVPNDVMISAADYYGQFIHDMSEWFQPDMLTKNDYIKFREASLMYTLPKTFVNRIGFQKIAVSLIARNLFYLYKTIKQIDPESALGSNSFVEYSPFPQMRSVGLKLDMSF
ncbi:SusC/RagA family TonB-linked outer membrane protein [Niabella drilacis]|uniref:Iron complex outermembrane recepter protein n=1 Tax=Niabella drilacis (strain DSM 25811 / CCM 8410 / CCUG 62505 / LMG 26954 / E90) TaxID=1285928 RepID=A0A1G6PV77_NIADE|nr:SusC/RagA family TonB-linked outer membrane protein [Niabella drilacis]SDC83426.1 iron complex outermembrane recepter protein [Niabella drilacis]